MEAFRSQQAPDGRIDDGAPEIFRPSAWLRGTVAVAACFWIFVFFLLVSLRDSSNQDFLGTGFFIALFTLVGIIYNNLAIEVTRESLIVRGIVSFETVPFKDVLKVEVKPGLVQTNYRVLARRGLINFTSLFTGHQRLMELIIERARLSQQI